MQWKISFCMPLVIFVYLRSLYFIYMREIFDIFYSERDLQYRWLILGSTSCGWCSRAVRLVHCSNSVKIFYATSTMNNSFECIFSGGLVANLNWGLEDLFKLISQRIEKMAKPTTTTKIEHITTISPYGAYITIGQTH